MSLQIVCVNAGNYLGKGHQYVTSLQASIAKHLTLPHSFIVFTDDGASYPDPIIKRPLPCAGLKGWWNKVALFDPRLFPEGSRVVYFDLDTLIVGSMDEIASYDGDHARLAPFFDNVLPPFDGPQSGVMAWRGGFGDKIWRTYELTGYPQDMKGGDQAFLNKVWPRPDLLQELFPGKIGSIKGDGGLIKEGRSVVCFHGEPRVHQLFPNGWGDLLPIEETGPIKKIGGYFWPTEDRVCWMDTLASVDEHVRHVLSHTPRRGVCVQAGGNVGVYAAKLAQHFSEVHTFEPELENFQCLERNLARLNNVKRHRAALSNVSGLVGLITNPANVGQARVSGVGDVPSVSIDGLGLAECDLIYLDIEGFEKFALMGAVETIRKFKPTVALEDNGLSEIYGVAKGEAQQWLASEFGYKISAVSNKDYVLTP